MNSWTVAAHSSEELSVKMEECIRTKFQPTLSIVFCSVVQPLSAIQDIFNQYDIALVGCTTAGEIHNGTHYDQAIVCLLLDPDKASFRIFESDSGTGNTYQQAHALGQFAQSTFTEPASVVFSGGFTVNADNIISGLQDAFGSLERPIFGALAGDDLQLNRTLVFSNRTVSDYGLYGLIFDNQRINCQGLAISGWEAIGTVHTITKADGNVVYTIDDQPALDFFIRYFGYFSSGEIQKQSLENMSTQYPLQILKENGNSVLRSPLIGNEKEGSLTLAAGVKEGDLFRFSMSPGFNVVDRTISEFAEFHDTFPEADALIMFSCKGRHSALGPFISDEIKGVYEHWQKPMIGFFSYGELGVDNQGYCDFHNETCSLLLLRER
ncbi:MAG: FIST C-terminal domain-containing protein [Lewinella sp.]|nr:FIST C-terminal domain-containing protein [Lewinella sp.]